MFKAQSSKTDSDIFYIDLFLVYISIIRYVWIGRTRLPAIGGENVRLIFELQTFSSVICDD